MKMLILIGVAGAAAVYFLTRRRGAVVTVDNQETALPPAVEQTTAPLPPAVREAVQTRTDRRAMRIK